MLTVTLAQESDLVRVIPSLEITRDRSIRPLRNALTNMGRMSNEGDRNSPVRPRPDASPEEVREREIQELDLRVYTFLRELESRLGPDHP